ncbi:intein [Nonlabens dokdonensis]|jgi:hypothetical protein|uniref:Uncharacterized protein n=2 Tax=Nonlabens dokdonensis TaxID=328515 RepID=L7WER6_NONDD|nr:hypothetical protein [Nonlabens dokdonensis]AGC78426.1 hypothetical protein DDD_3299 [Nonlabens dokdonensis DSW-6]PZX38174.1 intein [Nonlabens dokdonensis]
MRLVSVIFCLIFTLSNFNQSANKLNQIKAKVEAIENNTSLTEHYFDWTKISGITLDGGGILRVWKDDNSEVHKIYRELGLSYGRTRLTIYLEKGVPIKIEEIEENFGRTEQGMNYKELNEVFRVDIYVYDWEMDESKIERKGKRVMTETPCSTFDYEPTLKRALKAVD